MKNVLTFACLRRASVCSAGRCAGIKATGTAILSKARARIGYS